jgi:transposase InsO family protein
MNLQHYTDITSFYDNAPMESCCGTLKTELVRHRKYRSHQETMTEICKYIEVYYNRQRRHASLGNIFPSTFEMKYFRRQGAAWPTYGIHYCRPTSNNHINTDAD